MRTTTMSARSLNQFAQYLPPLSLLVDYSHTPHHGPYLHPRRFSPSVGSFSPSFRLCSEPTPFVQYSSSQVVGLVYHRRRGE